MPRITTNPTAVVEAYTDAQILAAVLALSQRLYLDYAFSTVTSPTVPTTPTTGTLRLNNADPTLATAMYVNETDANGVNRSDDVDVWDQTYGTTPGVITIRSKTTPAHFVAYYVSGANADAGTYDTVTLTYIDGLGTFALAEGVSVFFAPAASIANYLPKSGGTMAGDIAMGTRKVTGLGADSAAGDAVRFETIRDLVLRGCNRLATGPYSAVRATMGTPDGFLSCVSTSTVGIVGQPVKVTGGRTHVVLLRTLNHSNSHIAGIGVGITGDADAYLWGVGTSAFFVGHISGGVTSYTSLGTVVVPGADWALFRVTIPDTLGARSVVVDQALSLNGTWINWQTISLDVNSSGIASGGATVTVQALAEVVS